MKDLYLYENNTTGSPFQVICREGPREWAILPCHKDPLSKIYSQFFLTWDCRLKLSIGDDFRDLDGILLNNGSWSMALALDKDFSNMIKSFVPR
ncbi:MAG: hypothetical protein ACFFD2_09010 [Promethearchaeota archaeon]